ncbi:MAG: hypothetical protein JKX97_07960 [Candidatus Lindowbacteria bacterium]|nr:hypothetical protein [Candidatus Lindowbacteria bacterium]
MKKIVSNLPAAFVLLTGWSIGAWILVVFMSQVFASPDSDELDWGWKNNPVLTVDGELYYKGENRMFDFSGNEIEPDSVSSDFLEEALFHVNIPETNAFQRYGFRWRDKNEGWKGLFASVSDSLDWYFLADEGLLAVYQSPDTLVTKLGPAGIVCQENKDQRFSLDLSNAGYSSNSGWIIDAFGLYRINYDTPGLKTVVPRIGFPEAEQYSKWYAVTKNYAIWMNDSVISIFDSNASEVGSISVASTDFWIRYFFISSGIDTVGVLAQSSGEVNYDVLQVYSLSTGELMDSKIIRAQQNRGSSTSLDDLSVLQPFPLPLTVLFLAFVIPKTDRDQMLSDILRVWRENTLSELYRKIRSRLGEIRRHLSDERYNFPLGWAHLLGGVFGLAFGYYFEKRSTKTVLWGCLGLFMGIPIVMIIPSFRAWANSDVISENKAISPV